MGRGLELGLGLGLGLGFGLGRAFRACMFCMPLHS